MSRAGVGLWGGASEGAEAVSVSRRPSAAGTGGLSLAAAALVVAGLALALRSGEPSGPERPEAPSPRAAMPVTADPRPTPWEEVRDAVRRNREQIRILRARLRTHRAPAETSADRPQAGPSAALDAER